MPIFFDFVTDSDDLMVRTRINTGVISSSKDYHYKDGKLMHNPNPDSELQNKDNEVMEFIKPEKEIIKQGRERSRLIKFANRFRFNQVAP